MEFQVVLDSDSLSSYGDSRIVCLPAQFGFHPECGKQNVCVNNQNCCYFSILTYSLSIFRAILKNIFWASDLVGREDCQMSLLCEIQEVVVFCHSKLPSQK